MSRVAIVLLALCAPAPFALALDHENAEMCADPLLRIEESTPVDPPPPDFMRKAAASLSEPLQPPPVLMELPPRMPRDGHTLKAALVLSGVYAASFAIMWNMPEEETNWNKEDMGQRFLDAFRRGPVWDDDEWATNWVLHPWWGMWVYQTERNYGESMLRSFLICTAHSLFFEYVVEGWTERPSMQDLISTSPIGSLLGELVHRWIKHTGRDGFSRLERLLIDLLNPAYRWQIGFDRPVR